MQLDAFISLVSVQLIPVLPIFPHYWWIDTSQQPHPELISWAILRVSQSLVKLEIFAERISRGHLLSNLELLGIHRVWWEAPSCQERFKFDSSWDAGSELEFYNSLALPIKLQACVVLSTRGLTGSVFYCIKVDLKSLSWSGSKGTSLFLMIRVEISHFWTLH